METERVTIGRTVKKKLAITLLSGFLLFGLLLGIIGFSGTTFAVPMGGMGDFYVTFDELKGEGFELNPQIGETGNQDEAPLVRNKMEKATIDGLHIYKDLKMPIGGWIRINITASEPSEMQGLIQDARFIDADLQFDDMDIYETNTSEMSEEEAFRENWSQSGDTVTISDAKIVTDYLFQDMVALNGAKISVEGIDEPEEIEAGNDNGSGGNGTPSNDSTADDEGNGKSDDNGNDINNTNDSNSNSAATAKDEDKDDGSALPDTATQTILFIVIGFGLILLSIVIFVIRKKMKTTIDE
ncbi:MAG TPA: DUF6230 family protein [Pseudogracilibacillus sp.]|nr:DUF6230 family protein [Pseudogracilibacillus sp.]